MREALIASKDYLPVTFVLAKAINEKGGIVETRTLNAEVLGMAHGQEFYCRECCNKEMAEDTNMTVQDFYDLSGRGGFHAVLETATALTCQGCDTVIN